MVADFSARDIKSRRQPAVMTAFAVETDTTMVVYFASSLKGNKPFLVLPETNKPPDERVAQEVQDAILRCQQQYGPEHSNGFSCGEPLAIQTFLANNPEATVAGKGQITAYGVIGRDDSKNPVLGIKAPCEVIHTRISISRGWLLMSNSCRAGKVTGAVRTSLRQLESRPSARMEISQRLLLSIQQSSFRIVSTFKTAKNSISSTYRCGYTFRWSSTSWSCWSSYCSG